MFANQIVVHGNVGCVGNCCCWEKFCWEAGRVGGGGGKNGCLGGIGGAASCSGGCCGKNDGGIGGDGGGG